MEGTHNRGMSYEEMEAGFEKYNDIFSFTPEELSGPLLDVGAGAGECVEYIRNILGNTQAFGIEKSDRWIDSGSTALIQGDGLRLPFADNTFQTVVAKHYVLLFDDPSAVAELVRVARPGGVIKFDSMLDAEIDENTKLFIEQFIEPSHEDPETVKAALADLEHADYRRKVAGSKLIDYLTDLKMKGYTIHTEAQSPVSRLFTIGKPVSDIP